METLLAAIGLTETPTNEIYARSAIEWIGKHTTLTIDENSPESLPASVKLFILKYSQLMTVNTGIASESIGGLSQSFVTGQNLEMKLYELATSLLGYDCLKSTVTVYAGESKWDYGC